MRRVAAVSSDAFVHPERLSPREAAAIAGAYVRSPAYARASSLMRSAKVEDLKQVKVPITIAWGEHDALVRNKPLRDGILPKRVRQLVLPGCGHVPTWDDPDLVARVVLDGTARRGETLSAQHLERVKRMRRTQ